MKEYYELDINEGSIHISDLSKELNCIIRIIIDKLIYIEEDIVYKYCVYDYNSLGSIVKVLNNNGYECIN